MLLSETLRHFYRALGSPQETSPAAEAAITSFSDAISSAAKVGVGESRRVCPKEGEDALEALEGLFEKSTWMGGYSASTCQDKKSSHPTRKSMKKQRREEKARNRRPCTQ